MAQPEPALGGVPPAAVVAEPAEGPPELVPTEGGRSFAGEKLHLPRRWFLGPLPETIVSNTEKRVTKKHKRFGLFSANSSDNGMEEGADRQLSNIFKEHALSFFLRSGGKIEDWNDDKEDSVRREMVRKWRETGWGKALRRRKEEGYSSSQWVGESFEVGNLLGVNILIQEPAESLKDRLSGRTGGGPSSRRADDSFVTAPSVALSSAPATPMERPNPTEGTSRQSLQTAYTKPDVNRHTAPTLTSATSQDTNGETSSSTGLLPPSNRVGATLPTASSLKVGTSRRNIFKRKKPLSRIHSEENMDPQQPSDLPPAAKAKKRVHYDDIVQEAPPAPVQEVLQRTGSQIEETSAGAATQDPAHSDIEWGDVVMRDRMLVRVCYSQSDSIGSNFDEAQNRMTGSLKFEDWTELMVVWRMDRLELYQDYWVPGKEWAIGHKNLAYVVPLRGAVTKFSLYSFVDLTFCLTCPPVAQWTAELHSKARTLLHRAKEGTNIFVFKVRSRTRALDWTWQLWRELGGQIPSSIDVSSPALEARIEIEVPEVMDFERGYKVFSPTNVIELCRKSFSNVQDWKELVEQRLAEGKELALAWRMETKLDWIWMEYDAEGTRREWAVLCGLALKQGTKKPHLEIRLKEHTPTILHLPDPEATVLEEPPAIEGYLNRIKAKSGSKQPVYLSTHDGNLFSLSPKSCHPPTPPGLYPKYSSEDITASMHDSEVRRGASQVADAFGVIDLRSIVAVRRAFQVNAAASHPGREGEHTSRPVGLRSGHVDSSEDWGQQDRSSSDDEDEGGEDVLKTVHDRPRLRMKRSFELLINTGQVARFEAHSRRVALQWITRLRELIVYWGHRHRVDARAEMDLAQTTSGRAPITPVMHVNVDEDAVTKPPPSSDNEHPMLGIMFNWCVLDGCRPILRGGKIFMRKGLKGQYELVEMFLIHGHLVFYHIGPGSSLYKGASKPINLLDAYVCSGYFAALKLPAGQYDPNKASTPKRFPDGLEVDDPDEDVLFMIWYRHHPLGLIHSDNLNGEEYVTQAPDHPIPNLSTKREISVFRTRSKLERDTWCWAINCEIDRLTNRWKDREMKLRDTGELMKLS